MVYSKPAIGTSDQIALLQSRGLMISDPAVAAHFLTNISYYRLAGYWWSLQSDKGNHVFKPGSRFETAIDLYNFDRELRLHVFNAIERIEICLRTRLIHSLAIAHSPWWFEEPALFKNNTFWQKHIQNLDEELARSKEVFIQEHRRKYADDARRPPAWKSLEIISFGLLSKFYENLDNRLPEKDRIARELGTANHTYLISWLRSISVVRNICAHHGRLWNRHFANPPKFLPKPPLPWLASVPAQRNSLYAALCCMRYLLQSISPGNHLHTRLRDVFLKYPSVDIAALGFTVDWVAQPLWA